MRSLVVSDNGTAIIPPAPRRLGLDANWDRSDALNAICQPIFEAVHPERIELPVGIAAPRVMESQHLEDGAAVAQARASMMLLPYLCAIRISLRGSRDLDASKACLATSRR